MSIQKKLTTNCLKSCALAETNFQALSYTRGNEYPKSNGESLQAWARANVDEEAHDILPHQQSSTNQVEQQTHNDNATSQCKETS